MKTITQQNNNHCPLCHAALPHQRGHYTGWLPWPTVEYWMILRVRAGRKKHLLPITGCQRWQVGKKSAHGQWPPSSAQPHSIAFGSWHHQYATSKPLGVRWRASGRVFVFAGCVCVRVCTRVCVHVVNYSFVSHWRATATHPPLCAWRVRRQENPSSHEITDYILSVRPRGLDGGKTGKDGEEERGEERRRQKE